MEIRRISQSTIWFYSPRLVFFTTKLYCHAHYYNCCYCHAVSTFFALGFRDVELW
jgi:hypothetical protein